MKYTYYTEGTCSRAIEIDVENNIINSISFYGGCNGNLQGISTLLKGMTVDFAIERLSGLKCGGKNTSCPDQLSKALLKIKNQEI